MRVVLTGGGTGGHIYPALALARVIQAREPRTEFLYIGTEKGLESRLVPEAGLPFKTIQIQGLKRSLSWHNVKTAYYMWESVRRTQQLLKDFQPNVVVGTGGYVCGPVLYAASRLGLPSVIHEQNSIAGLTNRFLSRFVDRICVCFPESQASFGRFQNKVVFTGNPRAQEVAREEETVDLTRYGFDPEKKTVLIFGGSRGAQKINETLLELLPDFATKPYQVLLATGNRYYEEFKIAYPGLDEYDNIRAVAYIPDMPAHFKTVDLVVCRSGATTLTELEALGTPSILIPSPNVTANHQEKNAQSLVNHGAAEMLIEADLTAKALLERIDYIMTDDAYRQELAQASQALGVPDAGDRIYQEIRQLIA